MVVGLFEVQDNVLRGSARPLDTVSGVGPTRVGVPEEDKGWVRNLVESGAGELMRRDVVRGKIVALDGMLCLSATHCCCRHEVVEVDVDQIDFTAPGTVRFNLVYWKLRLHSWVQRLASSVRSEEHQAVLFFAVWSLAVGSVSVIHFAIDVDILHQD